MFGLSVQPPTTSSLPSGALAAHVMTRPVSSDLDAAMERYARGDDAAFAEVYDGLAPRLYVFVAANTRIYARAQDVAQQIMP